MQKLCLFFAWFWSNAQSSSPRNYRLQISWWTTKFSAKFVALASHNQLFRYSGNTRMTSSAHICIPNFFITFLIFLSEAKLESIRFWFRKFRNSPRNLGFFCKLWFRSSWRNLTTFSLLSFPPLFFDAKKNVTRLIQNTSYVVRWIRSFRRQNFQILHCLFCWHLKIHVFFDRYNLETNYTGIFFLFNLE